MSPKSSRRLPARYHAIVLPLILSFFMTCVVSCISTLRGVGLADGFWVLWLGSWGLSWFVAFPLLMAMLPLARALTRLWVEEP